MFDVHMYRSSVWQHLHRVYWIVDELLPYTKGLKIDKEKARVLALVHDDTEIIIGDYQAGHKGKMTKKQLKKLEDEEIEGCKRLAKRFPKEVHGYNYLDLLLTTARKDSPESLLVMYADRIDAHCECMHEILAGNYSAMWAFMFYDLWFGTFMTKNPVFAALFKTDSPFIFGDNRYEPDKLFAKDYERFEKPHTARSIQIATDFPFYNAWRKTVLRRGGKEGKKWLLERKESLRLK